MATENPELKWINARISLLWGVVLLVIAVMWPLGSEPRTAFFLLSGFQTGRALGPAVSVLWDWIKGKEKA